MKSPFMTLIFLCLIGTFFANAETTPPTENKNLTPSVVNASGDQLFVSSNTKKLTAALELQGDGSITMSTFRSIARDADGIYFDRSTDVLYQLNRSANKLNAYSGVSAALQSSSNPPLSIISTSNFTNGREIAISDGRLVVAQDASPDDNAFVIYNVSSTSIAYEKTFSSTINLWGIQMIGNTLYAIEDNSNRLAIYNDFLDGADGSTATPSTIVAIDGIVRTHGLTYYADSDLMILTDVGDGTVADDGALIVVENWSTASADGTVTMAEQLTISGPLTRLGNPVDVAYSPDENMIFVAERANTGGLILGFNFPTASGDRTPNYKEKFPGASSIHFSSTDVEECDNVRGGHVTFTGGGTEETTYFDGAPDVLTFETNIDAAAANHSFTYVVTDANGMILGIPPANMVDFNPAGLGVCRVYGVSYTGTLNIAVDDNFLAANLEISDDCFDVSDNFLSVNRINPPAQFFVSSNTSKKVGVIGVLDGDVAEVSSFPSIATDADGIYYDAGIDVIYQLNRTANRLNAYSNVSSNLALGSNPTLSAISTSNFTNGREIAVSQGKIIVAQDAADTNGDLDRFVIYNSSPNSIVYEKAYESSIALWGIHAEGSTLYAIEDVSDRLVIYDNFFDGADGSTPSGTVVTIEGIVRTHGLTYYAASDLMILTDVGSGAIADDGGLVVVENWSTAIEDGTVTTAEQLTIAGPMSLLGNPVDVAYDETSMMIFVAERANGGGRILGFDYPSTSGDAAPSYDALFAGASAIHTTNGPVDAFDFLQGGTVTFTGGGTERTTYFDGAPDVLTFETNIDAAAAGHSFTYVVTDANGMILGIPPANMVDFNPAGLGVCRVYGVSYTGTLNIAVDDDFLAANLEISDDCFDVSNNFLSVNRINAPDNFYVSSNNQKNVGVFGLLGGEVVQMSSFPVIAADADGIFYDEDTDVIYQLNRTASKLNAYSNANLNIQNGNNPTLSAISLSAFNNGREIAVTNGKIIVAQDEDNANQFDIYDASPSAITYDKTYESSFNLWGIHAEGNTLFAIEDNSNRLQVYENFLDGADGSIAVASATISVDGLVRTHGITYDSDLDLMILTDVGDGTVADDGAIIVVNDWTVASANGSIIAAEQLRIEGPMSLLGNPVDVAYDANSGVIFVAERANGGGRVLGFDFPTSDGDAAPIYDNLFAGASAIHLPGQGMPASANTEPKDITDNIETAVERSLENNEKTIVMDNLFPNPAMDQISISLTSTLSQETTVTIFDARGALIESREIGLNKGDNLQTFDIDNLNTGLYYLAIPAIGVKATFMKVVR